MPDKSPHKYPRSCATYEVAPGVRVLPADMRRVPSLGVFRWAERRVTFEDGRKGLAWVPLLKIKEAWMRITEAARLPLGLSAECIQTLIRAGFVTGSRGTPHSTQVNVLSLLEHLDATARDEHFWTRERVQRYKDWMVKATKKPGANGNANHVTAAPPEAAMVTLQPDEMREP